MARVTKRISPLTMSRLRESGFTLIEIMIVLAIVVSVTGLLLGRFGNSNNQIKESIRKIGVLSRDIHHRAKLQNVTYRLVIDMHSGEDDEEIPPQYWVERGSSPSLFTNEANHSSYDKREGEAETKEDEVDGEEPPPPADFAIETSLTPRKMELLGGLLFEDVEVISLKEKITSGIVYIYYLPEGLVDESAIHLGMGEERHWTLSIHPLTGRVEIATKYISLKEILER